MDILSTKPRMRLIVSVLVLMLITAGFYFGTRSTTQEDQLEADLAQKKGQLEEWSEDFLNEFPDVPAVKATVESYQEILTQVIERNEKLRQEGASRKKRIKQLTQYAKEISEPIAASTRSTELHLELMHKDTDLKMKIDRYMHADWMFPLPIYLLGLNKKEMRALQEQLQAP